MKFKKKVTQLSSHNTAPVLPVLFPIVNFSIYNFFFFLGQERFGNMTRVYYKEAVGAFIVFDVTRSATFDAVVKWKQDLDSKVQLPDSSPIPCILLANKVKFIFN